MSPRPDTPGRSVGRPSPGAAAGGSGRGGPVRAGLPDGDDGAASLQRFTPGERWVHRCTAVLVGVLLATAAILYLAPLAQLVGRRSLVAQIHVWAGLSLPVPLLVGWVGSRAFRGDAALMNRFVPADWQWLRRTDRRSGAIPVGKFNAGQKLNGAFTVGAIAVMVMTGSVMHWTGWFPLSWRTGATFAHDWLAFAVTVVVAGHVYMANRDPVARLGMRTGTVPLWWARREHAGWASGQPPRPGPPALPLIPGAGPGPADRDAN